MNEYVDQVVFFNGLADGKEFKKLGQVHKEFSSYLKGIHDEIEMH